jgi:LysR family hydrogen peroxide-inducible transcriptional activator
MNLQQLEYIVAVDEERHFVRAAEKCFVTQATLSAMIKKLEEELNCIIFDRSKQPVIPTVNGEKVILHAKNILRETKVLFNFAKEKSGEVEGLLRLGIIPTMAPYILPLFLANFLKKYPKVEIKIKELTTDEIILALEKEKIDFGILATPLENSSIKEFPVFYEEFVLYAQINEQILENKLVNVNDINPNSLWILEEGHCLRSQVVNFCKIKQTDGYINNLDFEAGSIETLINLVDANGGSTILPELAIKNFSELKMEQIRFFIEPQPVREVSVVAYRHYYKNKLLEALINCLQENVPKKMFNNKKKYITPINL